MVGIDEYVRPSIPKLRYAVADAKLFSQALQDTLSVPKDHIFLMTSDAVDENSQPRFVNVAYRLSYLKGKIKKDDTLIFYFAGHGVTLDGEPFLLTEEADNRSAGTLRATSLHAGDLISTLQKNESGNVWVTLDACRNSPDGKNEAKLDAAVNDSLSKANIGLLHTGTMFSCAVGERAWEWDEKKHGCYSYFMVEGMRSHAADEQGRVTLPGLDQYLREQVPAVTRRFGAPQNPKIFYGGSTSVPWVLATLAVVAEAGKKEDQTARYVARLEALQARLDGETALRVQAEQRAKLADSQRQQLEQQLAVMERQVTSKATPVSTGATGNANLVAYQDQAGSRALESEVNRLRAENDALKKRLANLEQEVAKVGMAPRSVMLQRAWEGAGQAQLKAEKDLGTSTDLKKSLQSCLDVRQALTQKVEVFQAGYSGPLAERPLDPALKKEVSTLNEALETRKLLTQIYEARQEAALSALAEAQLRLDEALIREEQYKARIAGLEQKVVELEKDRARLEATCASQQVQLSDALRQMKIYQDRFAREKKQAFEQSRLQYETQSRILDQVFEVQSQPDPRQATELPAPKP